MCVAAVTWSTEIGINISSRPGLLVEFKSQYVSVHGTGGAIGAITK